MLGARANASRRRTSFRMLLWSGVVAVALAGCKAASDNPGPGGSGGDGSGGSGSSSQGGTSGGSSGGSGGSGGAASSGGSEGRGGQGGSSGGASGGGQAGSGGSAGSAGGSAGSAGGSAGAAGGSAGGAGGSSVQCESDETGCYGACVNLQTDPKHCGKCGNVCAADECNGGVCKVVKDCFKKTVITDPVLADFEGYDGTTAPDQWGWAFNAPPGSDKAVYAGLYEYNDGTGSPAVGFVGPGYDDSKYAAKYATTSEASDWGGALGMWMGCIDASAYEGISFWVRGSVPGPTTFNLATEATSAPDKVDPAGGGTCTSGDCKGPSIEISVSTTWTQVLVNWDAMVPGTANGSTVTTTGGDITGMSWGAGLKFTSAGGDAAWVAVPGNYELQVDNIELIGSTPCEGGQKLCGTACTDATTDIKNCGTCGNACTGARTCTAGKCVCPSGYTECGTECVDLQIDAQNCNGCGKQCTGVCSGGTCQASTCTANMPQQNKKTNKGDNIDLGKYFINNNWWGDASASGSQSIWSTCSSGNTIGWGTEWNWSGGDGVISYASAVLGWHYGWKISNTGLPVQLSAGKKITCGWTYRVQPGKIINVSYDLFAHTQSNPTSDQMPTDEIMIWLYRAGGAAPIGGTVATVNLAGTSWELHQGSNGPWQVHSYVRTSNADTGATINISDFLNDLTANRGFSKSKYLTSIQAGTEVYQGSGRFDTDQYYCTIQ